jgi:uncharacterized protein with PIN domain
MSDLIQRSRRVAAACMCSPSLMLELCKALEAAQASAREHAEIAEVLSSQLEKARVRIEELESERGDGRLKAVPK